MSLAEEMLATMSASDESVSYLADEEPHIIIDGTRKIIVPNALKLIAVQGDKDIETVTFDCVRYWDGNDLSSFAIYINYILPNKAEGTYIPQNVTRFDDIFSFEWKIGKEITHTKGSLTFWIVAKLTNDYADVIKQWSSLQNSECTIAQGGDKTYVPESQTDKDVISQVLSVSQASALRAEEAAISAENRYELVRDLTGSVVELSGNALRDAKRAEAAAEQSAVKADSSLLSAENALQSERAAMEYESRARSSAESAARAATHAEAVVAGVNEKIERNSKRITNLEQGLPSEQFMTDSTVAHVKDVPVNALPFAEVSKVGGMTRKCRNLWNKGDVSGTNSYETSASYPAGTYTVGYVGNCENSQATKVRFVFKLANGKTRGQYLDKGKYVTATIECDADITAFWFAPTDTSGNQINAAFTVTNIMVNEGSIALPYEPYYEGLRDAKVTEIESVGKNFAVSTENPSQTNFGITITRIIGASFAVVNGTLTESYALRLFGYFKLPAGTYTASVFNINPTDRIYVGKGSNILVNYIQLNSPKTFTLTEEAECFIQIVFDKGSAYNNTEIQVQIERGDTATEYSPYTRNSLPVPEAVQALDGYGLGINADCYNYIDWEKKQFVKRVGKEVLTGTESWTLWKSNMHTIKFDAAAKHNSKVLSNCSYPVGMSSGLNALFVKTEGAFDVDTWKGYLATQYANGNPVTLYYELATPIITDISDLLSADNFLAVEGGGTITAVNENGLEAPSEITYMLKETTV